jgi:hypothetical protein
MSQHGHLFLRLLVVEIPLSSTFSVSPVFSERSSPPSPESCLVKRSRPSDLFLSSGVEDPGGSVSYLADMLDQRTDSLLGLRRARRTRPAASRGAPTEDGAQPETTGTGNAFEIIDNNITYLQ